MNLDALDDARAVLIRNSKQFWSLLREGKVQAANQMTDESDAMVAEWHGSGALAELLEPLLNSDDVEVRYLAAASLATKLSSERAYSILAEISSGPHGFISSSALGLLVLRSTP
jgi:hypothetical protein